MKIHVKTLIFCELYKRGKLKLGGELAITLYKLVKTVIVSDNDFMILI